VSLFLDFTARKSFWLSNTYITKVFIYRDLKPENILLHANGHIGLCDFDLSVRSAVQSHVVTKKYSHKSGVQSEPSLEWKDFVGTLEYLAPEVIQGKPCHASVDWWTLGILVYEMYYGVTPFVDSTSNKTMQNIVSHRHINFPSHPEHGTPGKKFQSLCKELICEENTRLGTKGGSTDIKDHPFFSTIKWQLLFNETPPIIPELSGPMDTHYFQELTETWQWNESDNSTEPGTNDHWKSFDYAVSESELRASSEFSKDRSPHTSNRNSPAHQSPNISTKFERK